MTARPLIALLLAVTLAGSAMADAPAPASAPAVTAPAAEAPRPAAPVAQVASPSAGNLTQTIVGLCLVLGLLAGLAWFLKRYGPKHVGQNAHMRIVGALNLGGRERIIVVEVGEQWIVVGASPGRVNALATMPKQADMPGPAVLDAYAPSASSFSEWLKQTIEKRK